MIQYVDPPPVHGSTLLLLKRVLTKLYYLAASFMSKYFEDNFQPTIFRSPFEQRTIPRLDYFCPSFASKLSQSLLLVCIFHTRSSLQSQSCIYNGPIKGNTNHGNLPIQTIEGGQKDVLYQEYQHLFKKTTKSTFIMRREKQLTVTKVL